MQNFRPWIWREVRLFELQILKTIGRHYSIQKWPSSKENWVEGGCDVIQSRHLNKRGYLSMQKRSAMVMFYPSSCVFCLRSHWKWLCRQVVALFDWMTLHPPSTQFSFLNRVMEGNRVLRIRSSKSWTSRQNHGLKLGMAGTYNTYFRNIKEKVRWLFYHSTTLRPWVSDRSQTHDLLEDKPMLTQLSHRYAVPIREMS